MYAAVAKCSGHSADGCGVGSGASPARSGRLNVRELENLEREHYGDALRGICAATHLLVLAVRRARAPYAEDALPPTFMVDGEAEM